MVVRAGKLMAGLNISFSNTRKRTLSGKRGHVIIRNMYLELHLQLLNTSIYIIYKLRKLAKCAEHILYYPYEMMDVNEAM